MPSRTERSIEVTRIIGDAGFLQEVEDAIAKGVPVAGYNFWSITSNREWGHPFDPNTDFGLYFVDLDKDPHLRRVPTPEVGIYQEIIRSGTARSAQAGVGIKQTKS
jgi:beta-glucosidase/6-phospho-beta-glucosidase/beta-galactosidase